MKLNPAVALPAHLAFHRWRLAVHRHHDSLWRVLVFSAGWCLVSALSASAFAKEPLPSHTIETGTLEDIVTAQGKLEPRQYVDVGAQISGQLKKIHTEIGDNVSPGQLLAEIDARLYDARVRADRARLKTLEAQFAEQNARVALAEQTHRRNKTLIKTHAISDETVQTSAANLDAARANLDAIAAQIEEAQSTLEGDITNLSYTRIFAPMAGTVVSQTAREGQTLNANQTAPVIMQIANLDTMTVRAQVAEADVMRLQIGTPVYFTTLGSQTRRWHGSVRQILPAPEIITDVVLYNALVDIDNRDRQLMTGMSTQMFFVLGRAENKPLIPISALGQRLPDNDTPEGTAYRVNVMVNDTPQQRTVIIGLMDRRQAEVRKGLSAGDRVIVQSETTPGNSAKPRYMGGPRL